MKGMSSKSRWKLFLLLGSFSSQSTDDLDIRAEAHLSLVDKEDHDDVMERLEQELDDDFDIAALREKRFQEMQQA